MQMLQLRGTLTAIIAVGFGTAWAGQQPGTTVPDPKVQEIVRAITPADTKRIDDKLVSFGTRSGISESTSTDTRGVVLARRWIASEFQAISDANGERGAEVRAAADQDSIRIKHRVGLDE